MIRACYSEMDMKTTLSAINFLLVIFKLSLLRWSKMQQQRAVFSRYTNVHCIVVARVQATVFLRFPYVCSLVSRTVARR